VSTLREGWEGKLKERGKKKLVEALQNEGGAANFLHKRKKAHSFKKERNLQAFTKITGGWKKSAGSP